MPVHGRCGHRRQGRAQAAASESECTSETAVGQKHEKVTQATPSVVAGLTKVKAVPTASWDDAVTEQLVGEIPLEAANEQVVPPNGNALRVQSNALAIGVTVWSSTLVACVLNERTFRLGVQAMGTTNT